MESAHQFMPHGYCISWDVPLLILHVVSDVFIALAYFSIPLGILYFAKQRKDQTFKPVYYLFAAFITACGLTHTMALVTLWYPMYYVSGLFKLLTAIISVVTAVYVIPKLPRMISLPDLGELVKLNQSLSEENASRKLAEDKLERSSSLLAETNKMLSTLLDALPVRVFWKDTERTYQGGNRLFLKDAGIERLEDLIGLTDLDMPWAEENAKTCQEDDQTVLTTHAELLQVEQQIRTAQDEELWLSINKVPLRDQNDDVIGIIGTYEDISEAKRAALELFEAKIAAEQANIAKSEFLANVSHEIRTPLNAVLGSLDLLRQTSVNYHQNNLIDISKRSAASLHGLLSDILDLSKIDSGTLQLEPQQENILEVLEDVAKGMEGKAEDKGLELLCPAHHLAPITAKIDRLRIKQVLNNLISNAIKFTEHGVITVDITTIETGRGHKRLRFNVSDSGMGISPEQQKSLFKRFSQIDSGATHRTAGTGLGLAISKELVSLMDGEMGVTSTQGLGSTFWFEINVETTEQDKETLATPLLRGLHLAVLAELPAYQYFFKDVLTQWSTMHHLADSVDELKSFLRRSDWNGHQIVIMDMDIFIDADMVTFQENIGKNLSFILLASQSSLVEPVAELTGIDYTLLSKPLFEKELSDAIMSLFPEQTQSRADSRQAITKYDYHVDAKILLVEDNAVNVMVAKGLIHMFGPEVDVAHNGQEALELLSKNEYDLVFMDCQMPVMDGYECTKQIRNPESVVLDHSIPIIAMTANAMRGDREYCLEIGMDDYIAKPVAADMLCEILKKWVCESTGSQHMTETDTGKEM